MDFTYEPVGATRDRLPEGFHHLRRSGVVGHGQHNFERASEAVLHWQAQRRSGIRVEASTDRARPGAVLRLQIGPRPLAVTAPARVVYVVDEEGRRGFAYGTLPGHPEAGEEAFVVELRPDGDVVLTVTAYSRPASLLTRAAGPVNAVFQRFMAGRYVAAIRRATREAA